MSCGLFRLQASLLLALAWLLNSGLAFAAQEIKSIPTRPGVTVKILLNIPEVPAESCAPHVSRRQRRQYVS